jgi:peptidoglycan/LPS O-acetylase OafA/YrhL
MGTLRTIFAIAVVFDHSWPSGIVFVGGKNAVQLFYVISGFLISYVLVEKKAYPNIKDFYVSRYLRLYPIYFFVAFLTIVNILYGFDSIKSSSFSSVYANAPISAHILLIFSNAFLFGQDWIMFSGVENNVLVFAKEFSKSEVVLYPGLVVPQAWTLGVELTFYLIAPFVLPKRKIVYLLLVLSLGVKIYLIGIGLGFKDPWTYRFFPAELALFLLGALSHQVLLPIYKRILAQKLDFCTNAATYLLIIFSIVYALIPTKEIWKPIFLFATFILLVPLAFLFQTRYRIDNWIGNLSYPIYVGHILAITICEFFLRKMGVENPYTLSLAGLIVAVGFAICLNKWIGEPFEKIRNQFRGAPKPSAVATRI